MANLINMNISSKENLGQPSLKKEGALLSKKGGDQKPSFSLSLDKALKGAEKKELEKDKGFSLKKGESKTLSLKSDFENSKLETKKTSPHKEELKVDSKKPQKLQDKNNIDNILSLVSESSQGIKNPSLLENILNSSNSFKNKNAQEDKILFTSKGRSVEVSIENLRKDSNSIKNIKNQNLRAQNSFKKEEKSFSLKPDLMIAEDLRFSSNTLNNTSIISSNSEVLKRDSLNFPSQFWQEWESKIDAQIIDKAKIILKDGNSGEIQLKLYPEKLGTVRVSLDIEGSQVLAKFILDNSQVKEVFEANSSSLQQGMEESGLSVSLNFSSLGGDGFQDDFEDERNNLSLALNNEKEILEADLSEDVQSLIDMII